MALFDYLCAECGPFEISRPIGTAESFEHCPACGHLAERTYSAPAVTSPGSALSRARDAAERSAHEPGVVNGTPPRTARQPKSTNPLHARLPRP